MKLRFEPFVGRPSDVCKLREPAANLFIEVPICSTYWRYLSLEVAVPTVPSWRYCNFFLRCRLGFTV